MSSHLILGGARSGKSVYAERLASALELPVTYIATAQVYDDEFAQRVEHHRLTGGWWKRHSTLGRLYSTTMRQTPA